jgi:hypothetical protein
MFVMFGPSLLVKLLFLDRAGLSLNALIDAPVAQLTTVLKGFEASRKGADDFDRILTSWRVNSCRATLESLTQVRAWPTGHSGGG